MDNSGDIVLAEKMAAGASMMKGYIAEMRRQGKIKGQLSVVIKDGKARIRLPFPELR